MNKDSAIESEKDTQLSLEAKKYIFEKLIREEEREKHSRSR